MSFKYRRVNLPSSWDVLYENYLNKISYHPDKREFSRNNPSNIRFDPRDFCPFIKPKKTAHSVLTFDEYIEEDRYG